MKNRRFFFGVLLGTALFVYLVSSFLIASFNIALWQDAHRFFAVAAYLFLVMSFLGETSKTEAGKKRRVEETSQENEVVQREKELQIEQSRVS